MPAIDPRADLDALARTLVAAVREAGALALSLCGRELETWTKHGGSPVSEADIAVDRLLRERLAAAAPDFGWRSEHEMTVKSKTIIQAFYGNAPRLSYWNGCSTGGRQGLQEAQRFPADYDGIIAGAPANRTAFSLWTAFAVLKDTQSFIPASKYPLIHQAALNACDAQESPSGRPGRRNGFQALRRRQIFLCQRKSRQK